MTTQATIAFLGGGNMATALAGGLLKQGIDPARICVAEPLPQRRKALETLLAGVTVISDNGLATANAHLVVVAVKPGVVDKVLGEVASRLAPQAVVLSIAAGVSLERLAARLPPGQALIRAMPNTPALIGAGITVLCPRPDVAEPQLELACSVMKAAGEVAVIRDEGLMDGVTALSGSGPAYVYLMAEALSDGGVACGLPRELADRLAVQTLIGAGRLLAESGQHPGVLKNQVTSPGGTTIAGLGALERAGVRGGLMEAVRAAWIRSRELN
ncbi:MAG: pyrroline-5-carboxylate reductase [Magnetococcales bacterium]|nr:pyrroline-5-carboxylate reductase [Magnetococcales bacterium]